MRVSFDRAAQFYDRTRGLPRHVMKQFVEKLATELHGYRTVLDAGVGTGRFAKPMQGCGFEVVGVDIAKKMIERAVGRGVDNLIQGDACFLPFKDNSFDATICIHLLHLISEWEMALHEICRVTRSAMVSMIYENPDPIREAYNRLLKDHGYESKKFGMGEWELKDLVKPSNKILVASYKRRANRRLNHLSQRVYSSQWEIPEEINRKVVEELKRQFWGKMFRQELHMLVWDIDDLKLHCC